ncbi:MAG: TauD/TfdA family dioxygenase, partial [Acidimicrobiales bacterium]
MDDSHRVCRRTTEQDGWTGADLDDDRSWEVRLDESHREELVAALDAVQSRRLGLTQITADEFPLPTVARLMQRIVAQLQHGLGFSVLRGFPVEDYDLDELEKLYWGLCSHVGTGITQNSDATLIHYVTDGALRPNQGTRGVGRPRKSGLHVDLTDCVSLLCVRQAGDNPMSWLGSSVRIHSEFERRAPEMLPMLYRGFEWDRLEEQADGEAPSTGYRVPVFSVAPGDSIEGSGGEIVSCRYNRHWMAMAA